MIIGIDPGLDGGIALLGEELQTFIMPTLDLDNGKRDLNLPLIVNILEAAKIDGKNRTVCFLEHVSALPKQGVTSTFTFGAGWGALRGILAALIIPTVLVRPQKWQKVSGKDAQAAAGLWPGHNFLATARCKKPHSGMVDAALIANYGRIVQCTER